MATTGETTIEARPFHVDISDEALEVLRRRIATMRWPSRELVSDRSQGVQLATIQELARYWATDYDWRRCEARLNALPQFKAEIDGVDIHFIHVRSRHEDALPLIMTHGWPGSVIELLEVVGPLTDPTAHGGRAEDAFDLVLPSIPGYGFSGEPTVLGWFAGRVAQAWAKLMLGLGYTRYVAQGGDQDPAVTDAMGPPGAGGAGRRTHEPARAGAGGLQRFPDGHQRGTRGVRPARRVQGERLRLFPRAGHAASDDWLRAARFTGRPRGVDARPRHRRLLQDFQRLRRGRALGQSDEGPHPRQHHAVLADRHRGLGRPVLLGGRTSNSSRGSQAPPAVRSRSDIRRSPARFSGRGAGG